MSKIRQYRPKRGEVHAIVDSISVLAAQGFLSCAAPVALIGGRARALLSIEQRRFLYEAVDGAQRWRLDGQRGAFGSSDVISSGRFFDESPVFRGVYWISGESLWCDVESLLSLPRASFQTNGATLLWLLLEEAARRAGLDVSSLENTREGKQTPVRTTPASDQYPEHGLTN